MYIYNGLIDLKMKLESDDISKIFQEIEKNEITCKVTHDQFIEIGFSTKQELKKVFNILKSIVLVNKQKVIFTGVGLTFYPEIKTMAKSIFGENLLFYNQNESLITYLSNASQNRVGLFKINTTDYSVSIKNVKKVEYTDLKFPYLLIDTRLNTKIQKVV